MGNHMFVHVPGDFWELLDRADFDEVEVGSRSGDQWASVAQAAVSVGNQGLAVTANVVGVYLARDRIKEFVQGAAVWFGFRAPVQGPPPPLVFTITGEGGAETRIEIRSAPGPDGRPVLDTAALTGAVVSAMNAPSPRAE
ncbi:hypothetical protein OG349_02450 [Streptomyces sp. NBC_01317]|uniref:hypothetical protein n=1 Tax=Streptomyces sp. NBC_01317 TaxID=2903822 RepID=UPI002E120ECB|nr:hypothetical protein OG349_02450 [Streptomyces sp. NBC_01317]